MSDKTRLFLFLLVLIPQQALTISTRLIETIPLSDAASSQVMVLDEFMLYIKEDGDSDVVWSHNHTTGNKHMLFRADSSAVDWLGKTNGVVVFVQHSDCCEKLWRTDGTQTGTQAISTGVAELQSSFQGPWLIGTFDRNQIFRTNGVQAQVFEVQRLHLDWSACAFENGDFIFSQATASQSKLFRVTGSQINEIGDQLTAGDEQMLFYGLNSQNNICFVYQAILPSRRILYAINQTGTVQPIVIQGNNYQQVREIRYDQGNDSYYVLLADEYNNDFRAAVSHIDISTGAVLNTYEIEDRRFALYDLSLSESSVVLRFGTPNETPEIPKILFLDKQLRLQSDLPFDEITGLIINRWRDKDLLLFMPWYYAETGTFYTVDSGSLSTAAPFSGFRGYDLDVSVNGQHAYLSGRSQDNNALVIHQLVSDPDIAEYTAGMWFDESRQNQGISINHGKRVDQSEYLFITVYTYADGQPVWFAAMVEIEPNMRSAEVPLFQFSGLNMWQQNMPAEQLRIGTLALKHHGCDQLNVSFTVGGGSQEFMVRRMHNVNFQNQCAH